MANRLFFVVAIKICDCKSHAISVQLHPEFHLDLDREGEEYQAGHCWLPEEIAPVIQGIQSGVNADGFGCKEPMASEMEERQWRADPIDGLRPLQHVRETWSQPVSAL